MNRLTHIIWYSGGINIWFSGYLSAKRGRMTYVEIK